MSVDLIRIPLLRIDPDLPLPSYARDGDAGVDLLASEAITLKPGERAAVRTGIAIALPDGWAGFVQPRSGLARRHGVTCLNTPGLIDSGYRGEIAVLLYNTDRVADHHIERGDRIAQLVVQRVGHASFEVVEELPDSARGDGGWGHTGS